MYAWLDRADIKISEGMDRYCQPLSDIPSPSSSSGSAC